MNTEPESRANEYLKGIVANLPEKPGIYQYLNTEGTIIYVGKAKNLKKRVYSYFSKEHEPGKTRVLVSKIADIRYIVVNTEEDALLLENNLIKKYKPRYNVLLKDDKTYPSICVQNEYFPRVFRTRKIIRNGSSYYGPYSHIPSMYAVLDLIKHLYPLRTCSLNLTPENIRAGKFNVCLEYHIKNCAGPCIGLQSQEDYLKNIDEIKEILKGNTQEISRMLQEESAWQSFLLSAAYGDSDMAFELLQMNAPEVDWNKRLKENANEKTDIQQTQQKYQAFTKLLERVNYAISYAEFLESVKTQAQSMSKLSLFSDVDSFSEKNIQKTAEAYEKMNAVQPGLTYSDAVERLGGSLENDRENIVMIGDTWFDTKGARLCGVDFVGIEYAYQSSYLPSQFLAYFFHYLNA